MIVDKDLVHWLLALASEAGSIVLSRYANGCDPDTKGDGTFVTEADRECETFLRERIAAKFREHAILGEEQGWTGIGEGRPSWIIDPIDGTFSFVHGVPLFGILIALAIEEEPVLGVAHFPALGETVWGGQGLGCFRDDQPVSVRSCGSVHDALICATSLDGLHPGPISRIVQAAGSFRTWGDSYGQILVATGRADSMVDPVQKPWDIAAPAAIIRAAGGTVSDLEGKQERILRAKGTVATAGGIHDELLALLRT